MDCVALLHAPHEGPARLGPALEAAGFRVIERLRDPRPEDARVPLLVVLGGPMGAYDADRFPFLAAEQDLLRERLAAGRPSIGLCLGAQLLAAAAGATVAPGVHGTAVGVGPVRAVPVALESPLLRGLPPAIDVVHWHGDTFAPVPGQPLFTAEPYAAQGFRVGRSVGLQFHPELGPDEFRTWVELERASLREGGHDPDALLAEGLPRLARSLPVLDRLLAALAREARAAVRPD